MIPIEASRVPINAKGRISPHGSCLLMSNFNAEIENAQLFFHLGR
jgi:hypothetical protein